MNVLLCLQLRFAAMVSIIYAILMMIVLVGLIRQIADYGFCSVTTIFFITIVGIFVVAAILHPQVRYYAFHTDTVIMIIVVGIHVVLFTVVL